MNRFFNYFLLRLKLSFRFLPSLIIFILALSLSFGILAAALLMNGQTKDDDRRFTIALAGDVSHSYFELALQAMETMDTSAAYSRFEVMDKETAETALKNNDVSAVVYVPDGFVSGLLAGEDVKVKLYLSNDPTSLGPMLIREISDVLSTLAMHTQAGIYAYQDVAKEQGVSSEDMSDSNRNLNFEYLRLFLSRSQNYEIITVKGINQLPLTDYYFSAIFLVLVMLGTASLCTLAIQGDMALTGLLHRKGLGSMRQILCEYIPFLLIIFIASCVIILASGAVFSWTCASVPSAFSDFSHYILLCGKALFAVMLLSSMQFFIFQLCSSLISGVLSQIITILSLSLASGFFLPLSSLPKAMQMLASYLPSGIAFSSLCSFVSFEESFSSYLLPLLLAAVFLALCAAVRKLRLGGKKNG